MAKIGILAAVLLFVAVIVYLMFREMECGSAY